MSVLLVGPEIEENLSIRYLSSSLHAAGHKVDIAPLNCRNDIESVISAASKAELVGISMCFQVRMSEYLELARRIKAVNPTKLIVAGGHYASCAAEDLLQHHLEIDLVVIHEGEQTLVEIVESYPDLHNRLPQIKGIAYRQGRNVHFTAPRPINEDLDGMSLPDRRGPIRLLSGVPTAYILGSRGCYGSCDYCCISTLHRLAPGKRFRQRSPENVSDEMAELFHERGIRQFIFEDDNFLVPSKEKNIRRLEALENALNKRGVKDIGYAIKCRPADVDYDVFRILKQMGLLRVFLGIESANTIGLSSIGRKQTVAESERALGICEKLEISSQYTLMIFHPDATIDTIKTDIEFMKKHIKQPICLTRVDVLAGTPLEKRLIEAGRAQGDYLGRYYHLNDPIADLVCNIAQKTILARYGMNKNLTYFAIGMDHLAEVLKHFYRGNEVNELHKDIHTWCNEVNVSNVDLLEKLLDICSSRSNTFKMDTQSDFQKFYNEESSSRIRLLKEGEELRIRLENLAAQMVGLGNDAKPLQINHSKRIIFARHATAVALAVAIVGGIPSMGIADYAKEERYWEDDDELKDIYEDEIFNTDPESHDTDRDGIPDEFEDHDEDGIPNIEEQNFMDRLMEAVEIGDIGAVKFSLDTGAYADARDDEGMTALMRASLHGNMEITQMLLESGANINAVDNHGATALIRALENENTTIVEYLLQAGADINPVTDDGVTALNAAVTSNQPSLLQMLIEAGADVNARNWQGITPLMIASHHGNSKAVELLIDGGADVNTQDRNKNTALIWASANGKPENVKLLIEAGASVNAKNEDGENPLIQASYEGHTEIVEMLIEADADVNAKNEDGENPIMLASDRGHIKIVEMLIEESSDVNDQDKYGTTALIRASYKGHTEIIEMLIGAGADVEVQDRHGLTPLLIVWNRVDPRVVELLIIEGADVNARDSNGETALIWESFRGKTEIVKMLIETGADVDIKNEDGETALMRASYTGRTDIVKMLIGAGADIDAKDNKNRNALRWALKGRSEKAKVEKHIYDDILNLLR